MDTLYKIINYKPLQLLSNIVLIAMFSYALWLYNNLEPLAHDYQSKRLMVTISIVFLVPMVLAALFNLYCLAFAFVAKKKKA